MFKDKDKPGGSSAQMGEFALYEPELQPGEYVQGQGQARGKQCSDGAVNIKNSKQLQPGEEDHHGVGPTMQAEALHRWHNRYYHRRLSQRDSIKKVKVYPLSREKVHEGVGQLFATISCKI